MKLLKILLEDTRIESIAQRLANAYNTYYGKTTVSIKPDTTTDSRFELLFDGNSLGGSYFSVNILGDVYLSDGLNDQYFFNEKDSDQKLQKAVNKILDKSTKETGNRWTPDEEEQEEPVDEISAKQLFTAAGIGLATLGAPNMGKAQQKEPTPISQTTQQKDTTMTGFGIGKSSEHRIAKQMARMKATADLMQKMKVQTLKGGIEIKSEKTFQTANGYEVEMTVAVSQ